MLEDVIAARLLDNYPANLINDVVPDSGLSWPTIIALQEPLRLASIRS